MMSDSEGDEKSSFTPPKYSGNYAEFEPQFDAFGTLRGFDLAFDVDGTEDYVPSGETELSTNIDIPNKQRFFVKKNLQCIVALQYAFKSHSDLFSFVQNSSNVLRFTALRVLVRVFWGLWHSIMGK